MPILISFPPLLTTKSTVDVSAQINSLRVSSNPQSQRLADALEQIQAIIYILLRSLRAAPNPNGDTIQVTGAGGEQGATVTSTYIDSKLEYRLNGALVLTSGTGDPNGVVTASPGALYTDLSGGAGVTLWVKESGTGTDTGWVSK